jgi:hypothetical protein
VLIFNWIVPFTAEQEANRLVLLVIAGIIGAATSDRFMFFESYKSKHKESGIWRHEVKAEGFELSRDAEVAPGTKAGCAS